MATATVSPDNTAVIAEVFIAAPPERVFQVISDPEQLSHWWGQNGLYRITERGADLNVGEGGGAKAQARTENPSASRVNIWKLIRRGVWFTPGPPATWVN